MVFSSLSPLLRSVDVVAEMSLLQISEYQLIALHRPPVAGCGTPFFSSSRRTFSLFYSLLETPLFLRPLVGVTHLFSREPPSPFFFPFLPGLRLRSPFPFSATTPVRRKLHFEPALDGRLGSFFFFDSSRVARPAGLSVVFPNAPPRVCSMPLTIKAFRSSYGEFCFTPPAGPRSIDFREPLPPHTPIPRGPTERGGHSRPPSSLPTPNRWMVLTFFSEGVPVSPA